MQNGSEGLAALQTECSECLKAIRSGQEARIDADRAVDTLVSALAHSADAATVSSVLSITGLLLELAPAAELDRRQEDVLADLLWTHWPEGASAGPEKTGGLLQKARIALDALLEHADSARTMLLDRCAEAPLANKRTLHFLTLLANKDREAVIARLPGLFARTLQPLDREDLAPSLCKLAIAVLPDDEAATSPIVDAAVDATRQVGVSVQLFPLLARSRSSLIAPLLSALSSAHGEQVIRLRSVLALASVGLAANALQRTDLPSDVLTSSLEGHDGHLRLHALGLLLESSSTSAPLALDDFDLIEAFYERDLATADPDFRQRMFGHTMKLLDRLRLSSYAAARDAKRTRDGDAAKETGEAYVERVRAFLARRIEAVVHDLRPAAPYRVSIAALRMLDVMLQTMLDPRWQGTRIKALQPATISAKGKAKAAQPGVSWPFELDILNVRLSRTLVRRLVSTYDDIRNEAATLLRGFADPLPGFNTLETVDQELIQPAFALLNDRRESETATGALVLEVVTPELPELGGSTLFDRILDLAEHNLTLAESDFAIAAQASPVHGPLLALRRLLEIDATLLLRSGLFSRLHNLVDRVWRLAEPILCNAAPTGENAASDHEDHRAMQMAEAGDDEDLGDESGGPRHKVILSAAFRAMKEAAYLIEALVCLPLSSQDDQLAQVWTSSALSRVGVLFSDWLQRIRHRGTWSHAYPRFSKICEALAARPELSTLPRQWLSIHLDVIASPASHLTTRRSAGLPFCVMAILLGTRLKQSELVDVAISRLLDISEPTTDSSEDAKVHAMNTLRVLFIEGDLAQDVKPHIERGFRLALGSFKSPSWSVRNVSLLLYAALIHRTFGMRGASSKRDRATFSKRMSSLDLFTRFPSLRTLLLDELAWSVKSSSHDLPVCWPLSSFAEFPSLPMCSSLYSVLLLLSLLQSSNSIARSAELNAPFLPLIEACASSRVWMARRLTLTFLRAQIRSIAAYAAAGLLSPAASVDRAVRLLSTPAQSENELHGRLLQVLRPLEMLVPDDDGRGRVVQTVEAVAPVILQPGAHCSFVQKALIDIALAAEKTFGVANPACQLLAATTSDQPGNAALIASLRQVLSLSGSTVNGNGTHSEASGPGESRTELRARYDAAWGSKQAPLLLALVERSQEIHDVIELIEAAASPFETAEMRLAAAQSLALLRSASAQDQARILQIQLELVQDDDEEIRETARQSIGSDRHLAIIAESIVRDLAQLVEPVKVVQRLVLRDCAEAIETLRSPSAQLFAEEPPNLYRDELLDIKLCQRLLGSEANSDALARPLDGLLSSFSALIGDQSLDAPLGILSDRMAWRTAHQLVTAFDLVHDSALNSRWSSFITRLRSGLSLSC